MAQGLSTWFVICRSWIRTITQDTNMICHRICYEISIICKWQHLTVKLSLCYWSKFDSAKISASKHRNSTKIDVLQISSRFARLMQISELARRFVPAQRVLRELGVTGLFATCQFQCRELLM